MNKRGAVPKEAWRDIEKLRAKGYTLQSIANQYGVSKQAIHQKLANMVTNKE